jgi:elongation factor G
MRVYDISKIRNIAVAGHQGCGKTSLLEAFLFLSKATNRMGKVEDGNTASDFDDDERERQMSINLSVIPVEINDMKLNFIDTPGYTEFQGEVQQAIRVADAVLILVDAVSGPEVGTELAIQFADNFLQPILICINKMDRENASFQRTLEGLRARFPDHKFVPVMLPIGEQAHFKGVANVLTKKAYLQEGRSATDLPADVQDEAEAAHQFLAEAAAETSDALIEKYFETGDLSFEEIREGMRTAARSADLKTIPVFISSGTANIGTYPLLEAMSVYVAEPAERRAAWVTPKGEREFLNPPQSDEGPLAGYIFKEYTDKFGTISFFRLFSGKIKANDTVYIPNHSTEERFGQLMVVRGKEQFPVEEIRAGDIGAVAKLKSAHTGDTLTTKGNHNRLLAPELGKPVYAVSVHPRTQADGAKLGPTLSSMCSSDMTLHWRQEAATKETLLEGMGGIHIEIAIKRAERLGCHIDTTLPKVPYQETITKTASAEYTHKKQSGGAGQYGRVNLRIEPISPDQPFEFASEVFGGAVSGQFIASTEKGVRQVLETGVVAGYPVVGVKAIIFDGKMHDVDSKDIAFQIAGRGAFKEAFANARPVLLEPYMKLRVIVPEESMGDIMSDMSGRRGSVQGMDTEAGRSVISAVAPLAEVQRYANDLRSMTSGRGVFTMEFSHYDRMPEHLSQPIIQSYKGEKEEA